MSGSGSISGVPKAYSVIIAISKCLFQHQKPDAWEEMADTGYTEGYNGKWLFGELQPEL